MIDSFLSFSGTNKGTNTQWSLCGVSSVQLTGKVDVVRTAPSLAVSGGED